MGQIRDLDLVPSGPCTERSARYRERNAQAARPAPHSGEPVLEERLHAARSSSRFADRRIAQLAEDATKP